MSGVLAKCNSPAVLFSPSGKTETSLLCYQQSQPEMLPNTKGKTRKLTKSTRAPQGVYPSPSETHKVKFISARSKVTGPKCHAHVHLSLMGSPQTQTGHTDIDTMDTGSRS